MKNQDLESVQRLAARIRLLRTKAKLSQAKLAEKAGLTDGAIKMIETARRQPRAETLELIARALDCSVESLFSDKEEKPPTMTTTEVASMFKSQLQELANGVDLSRVPKDILQKLTTATPEQFEVIRVFLEPPADESEPSARVSRQPDQGAALFHPEGKKKA